MSFRIISGQFRNRELASPKGSQTRPTTAIVRKSVFDVCRPYLENARVLDVFAGSGAMGIEAISQGASHATFIENHRFALDCIRQNIEALGINKQCKILAGDAISTLSRLKEGFDLIYIDPPYHEEYLSKKSTILQMIDSQNLLNQGGILFIEEQAPSSQNYDKMELSHLRFKTLRKFGKAVLYQFERP